MNHVTDIARSGRKAGVAIGGAHSTQDQWTLGTRYRTQ